MTGVQIINFKAFGLGYKLTVDSATVDFQNWLQRSSGTFKIIQVVATHAVERDNKHCYTLTVIYQ